MEKTFKEIPVGAKFFYKETTWYKRTKVTAEIIESNYIASFTPGRKLYIHQTVICKEL